MYLVLSPTLYCIIILYCTIYYILYCTVLLPPVTALVTEWVVTCGHCAPSKTHREVAPSLWHLPRSWCDRGNVIMCHPRPTQPLLSNQFICCTLRSWVQKVFIHSRTVSRQLGDNYALKCISDNFSHTEYISPCVENSQNHTLIFHFSPIPRRRFENWENCGTDFSHSFSSFHDLLPAIGDQQYIAM